MVKEHNTICCNRLEINTILWLLWGIDGIIMAVLAFVYTESNYNHANHKTLYSLKILIAISAVIFAYPIIFATCKLCVRALNEPFSYHPQFDQNTRHGRQKRSRLHVVEKINNNKLDMGHSGTSSIPTIIYDTSLPSHEPQGENNIPIHIHRQATSNSCHAS